jgi:hypothetical protein
VTPLDTLQATLDAIETLNTARRSIDGVNAVTGVLWRAANVLERDARRMLTGPGVAVQL